MVIRIPTQQEEDLLVKMRSLGSDEERIETVLGWDCYVNSSLRRSFKDEFPRMDLKRIDEKREADRQGGKHLVPSRKAPSMLRGMKSKLEAYIAPLPMGSVKRLDAVIRDLSYWQRHTEALQEFGIDISDVLARRDLVEARKQARKDAQLEADMVRVAELLIENPFTDLGVTLTTSDRVPAMTIFRLDASAYLEGMEPILRRQVTWALETIVRKLNLRHPTACQDQTFTADMPPLPVISLYEKADSVKSNIRAVLTVEPGALRTINLPDAAEFCGMPKAAFRDEVDKDRIPVAEVETFRKWGRELFAYRFDLGTLKELREMGEFDRLLEKRANKVAANRRKGAAAAKVTRERRAAMREQLTLEMRSARAKAAGSGGGFEGANHLELWTWAQRASRQAKTMPSKSEVLYDLKDDAILCLHEVGALEVSFVDGSRERLKSKCAYHSSGWFHFDELECCPDCSFGISHYYSLYSFNLKDFPEVSGLHMPYPTGQAAGLPKLGGLPKADHDRDITFGRRLDVDEKAIFTSEMIEKEIRRLIAIVERVDEDGEVEV